MNAVRPATTESALPDAPWPRVKLGEVCELYQPHTLSLKDIACGGPYPVYGANGIIGHHSEFNHENPELIMGCRGVCGVLHITEPRSWINGNAMVIHPISNQLRLDYLKAYLESATKAIAEATTGTAQPQITRTSLSPISLPLPPLSVQRSIVARLDAELARADRMREQFLHLAESAAARFRAILAETFEQGEPGDSGEGGASRRSGASGSSGDSGFPRPRVKLGEVCELKSGFTPKPEEIAESGDTPYFRIASMNEAENDVEMVKPIGYYIGKNNRRFPKGALIFPKNGGAALTHKIRYLVTDSIVDLNTGVFLPAESLDTDFLYYWFFALPIDRVLVTGTLPFVDFPRLSQQTLPLPPLSVQRSIVARLDAAQADCGRIEELARKGAEGCAALRAALLKEAFE